MGFLSYNLKIYTAAIQALEQGTGEREALYGAKQLLKFVDDITDEGYPDLARTLEENGQILSRFRAYLSAHGEEPFALRSALPFPSVEYAEVCEPLEGFLSEITALALDAVAGENPFLSELRDFSLWLGEETDCAYLFLLRDTLLPYLWFRAHRSAPAVPLLLGRKMMWELTAVQDSEDLAVRSVINDALEQGRAESYEELLRFCIPRIRENLSAYPAFVESVQGLLSGISEEKLLVVESGCYGTFPLLLAALDERVDIRMYTSIPMLAKAYGQRLYTCAYEKNRSFETLYSQDLLFHYAGVKNGQFLIRRCTDAGLLQLSLQEISRILQ